MVEDYEYHQTKKPGKTYVSKSIALKDQPGRRIRIASKVIDTTETHAFDREASGLSAVERGELVIRVTPGLREEIVAKFYEDNRQIHVLTLQRFLRRSGTPTRVHFSFVGDEINQLLEFILNMKRLHLPDDARMNVTDSELRKMILSTQRASILFEDNEEAFAAVIRTKATKEDIVALGYRKSQLEKFRRFLHDPTYFAAECETANCTEEALWQHFFERNTWIFGYGLSYVFLTGLDEKKLESVVRGYSMSGHGKRVDALMKTRGLISSLCFVEIKKHTTPLLSARPYRPGCWSASPELAGAVSQVQGTVQQATADIAHRLEPKDPAGDFTGETIFNYQSRGFLVAGSLGEFMSEHGTNEERYRSFELYRRNTFHPEIITFDELYDRARYIVESP